MLLLTSQCRPYTVDDDFFATDIGHRSNRRRLRLRVSPYTCCVCLCFREFAWRRSSRQAAAVAAHACQLLSHSCCCWRARCCRPLGCEKWGHFRRPPAGQRHRQQRTRQPTRNAAYCCRSRSTVPAPSALPPHPTYRPTTGTAAAALSRRSARTRSSEKLRSRTRSGRPGSQRLQPG